jgi:hypothetical protein
VSSGPVFTISSASASTLEFSGTATSAAPITINNVNQTLQVGSAGALTINGGAESITNGSITLSGGILTDATGLTIGAGATLSGFGTVTGPISGNGIVQAIGGTLDVTSNITATNVTGMVVANSSSSILEFAGTVASGDIATFNGGAGTLDLSNTTAQQGFRGTIAGMTVAARRRYSPTAVLPTPIASAISRSLMPIRASAEAPREPSASQLLSRASDPSPLLVEGEGSTDSDADGSSPQPFTGLPAIVGTLPAMGRITQGHC